VNEADMPMAQENDGPGWEQQQETEKKWWDDAQAIERHKQLAAEFKEEGDEFRRQWLEHEDRMWRSQWQESEAFNSAFDEQQTRIARLGATLWR
jgi:hypothetical protein